MPGFGWDLFDDDYLAAHGGALPAAGAHRKVGPADLTRAQDAAAWDLIRSRGRMASAPRAAMPETLPDDPFELAAWQAERNTPQNVGAAVGRNMLDSYSNFGRDLGGLFNSATGPYGQLQFAAAQTAPSRAARDIAGINAAVDMERTRSQREIAEKLVDSLFSGNAASGFSPLTGMTTGYGAGVQMPRRPQHVDVSRFRRQNPAAALFA